MKLTRPQWLVAAGIGLLVFKLLPPPIQWFLVFAPAAAGGLLIYLAAQKEHDAKRKEPKPNA